jgi:hypothetical protein
MTINPTAISPSALFAATEPVVALVRIWFENSTCVGHFGA